MEVGGGIVKVIPLIENSRVEKFHSEKGLSLYIESKDKKILFDTGKSGNLIKNLKKMEIDIFDIDYFIISHGHRDHIGGLKYLLDMGIDPQRVVIERGALNTFSFKWIFKREIGLTQEELEKLEGVRGVEVDGIYKLEESMYLISPGGGDSLLYYKNGERDDFSHEISLVVVEDDKLNIVVGCCHFGLERLVDLVKRQFKGREINSITGGLHTRSLPFNPIAAMKFISFLKGCGVRRYYLGHCTGRWTILLLRRFIGGVNRIFIGRRYDL